MAKMLHDVSFTATVIANIGFAISFTQTSVAIIFFEINFTETAIANSFFLNRLYRNGDIFFLKIGFTAFENQNSNYFAEVILNLWTDKLKYEKMSQNAVEYAKKYDLSEYTDKLVCYYQNLLNKPS